MKKIDSLEYRGGGSFKPCFRTFLSYTLAEIVVVMLIIAVVVAVSIGITKAKLDNIISYTYYSAYSSLRQISTEMLINWDPTDPEYKQALNASEHHFAFNFPNDHRFFSTLISHTSFAIKLPFNNKVKAGSTVTAYGCPQAQSGFDDFMWSTEYYIGANGCYTAMHNSYMRGETYADLKKCGGKYHGATTYTASQSGGNSGCTYDCSTGHVNTNLCGAGSSTCCGNYVLDHSHDCTSDPVIFDGTILSEGDNYLEHLYDVELKNGKVISSTLMSNNVCKMQIQCDDGYYWETEDSVAGFPIGSCKKCYKTCKDNFTLDSSTCSCVCEKKCGTGYKLNSSTCTCVSDGGSSCTKTCGDGYTLDKKSCSCKCTRSCSSGYSLDSSSCTCKKDACTNKPSTIPCGQSWDEENCKLTGTKKTCDDGYSLDSSCNCKCTRSCSSGYSLDTSSCTCKKDECTNKPSTIPCGQSWDADTCSLTGTAKTCEDGYSLDSDCNCKCTRTCGDGYTLNSSTCTCEEDGCPAPDYIPCGQSWDESTCSLTGTAKTCPSGQHLNSSCNCVNDCPTDLTPCQICSYNTGIVSQNPLINRTCSDETYEWSEDQCKCIISPRTLPRKGMNFCKLFERYANIKGGSPVCSGSAISTNTTNFSSKEPDLVLRNGLLLYNMHNDAIEIPQLQNNTQGGTYDGVPNTNTMGYIVYVDIDGVNGSSQLWDDVYPFYITLSGKIIPGYDLNANPDGSGGDSSHHLAVSVENETYNSGKRKINWLAKSVSFKEGACLSGYVGSSTPYCRSGSAISQSASCDINMRDSLCRLKRIKPVRFFF